MALNEIAPLDTDTDLQPKKWGQIIAFGVTYLLLTGAILGGLFLGIEERDRLKKDISDLRAELNQKTSIIEQLGKLGTEGGVTKLTIPGDLKVEGNTELDKNLEVKGESKFGGKVSVVHPLVIARNSTTDEYLIQYKTGEDISWSLGVGASSASDRSALNFYNGAGVNDPVMRLDSAGHLLLVNSSNGASAFEVQNSAKSVLFQVNSQDSKISVNADLLVGGGTAVKKIMHGTCNVDPPSLSSGSKGNSTCTAGGVAAGDRVYVTPSNSLETDLLWQLGGISGADSIQIRFKNDSGGALDGVSGVWYWFALR